MVSKCNFSLFCYRFLEKAEYQESDLLPDYMIVVAQSPKIEPVKLLQEKKNKKPAKPYWTITGKLIGPDGQEVTSAYTSPSSSKTSSLIGHSAPASSVTSDCYPESEASEISHVSGATSEPLESKESDVNGKIDAIIGENIPAENVKTDVTESDSIMMDPVVVEAGPRRNSPPLINSGKPQNNQMDANITEQKPETKRREAQTDDSLTVSVSTESANLEEVKAMVKELQQSGHLKSSSQDLVVDPGCSKHETAAKEGQPVAKHPDEVILL